MRARSIFILSPQDAPRLLVDLGRLLYRGYSSGFVHLETARERRRWSHNYDYVKRDSDAFVSRRKTYEPHEFTLHYIYMPRF